MPSMVTHQPKDGHPPEGSVLQTWNLTFNLNSQNYIQMTLAMDGYLPSLGWSPTNPRMVTHQKEVNYKLGIWHLDCHTRLHLGFSANLRIWQVPACKMEPRSGTIICLNHLTTQPAGHRTTSILLLLLLFISTANF